MMNIEFQGKEWLFVGGSLEDGGAITTPEAYATGEVSYAHLGRDGVIRRYLEEIGSIEDIKVLGPAEDPDMSLDGMIKVITGDGWERPT